jgi:hypothetical protein
MLKPAGVETNILPPDRVTPLVLADGNEKLVVKVFPPSVDMQNPPSVAAYTVLPDAAIP